MSWEAEAETLRCRFVKGHAEALGFPLARWWDDSHFLWETLFAQDQERFLASCQAATRGHPSVGRYLVRGARAAPRLFQLSLDAVRKRGTVWLLGQMVGITQGDGAAPGFSLAPEEPGALGRLITRLDPQLRHSDMSPSCEQLLGIPPAVFLGKTNEELGMPPQLVRLWNEGFRRAFRRGEQQELEFRFLIMGEGREPQPARMHSRLIPEFDQEGQVRSVLAVVHAFSAARFGRRASRVTRGKPASPQGLEPLSSRTRTPRAHTLTAEERLAWVTRVGQTLAKGLDTRELFRRIEQLALPWLGDRGGVALLQGQGLERMALFPDSPGGEQGPWARLFPILTRALHTGRAQLLSGSPELVLQAVSLDEEHLGQLRGAGLTDFLVVPLRWDGDVLGCLWFASTDPTGPLGAEDLALAEVLAVLASPALDAARLHWIEREIRQREGVLEHRTEALHRVAVSLGMALLPAQIADAVMNEVKDTLFARAAAVYRVDASGTAAELLHASGYDSQVRRRYARIPLTMNAPITCALKQQTAIWVESGRVMRERYPELVSRVPEIIDGAWMALPLWVEGRVIGGLVLSFGTARTFSPEERAFALALAQLCAQALERARLYQEAQEAIALRDQFVLVAGHELKTPLTALLLSLANLQRRGLEEPPEALRRRIAQCQSQANQLKRLMNELLDVRRLTRDMLRLNKEEFELTAFVEDAVQRMMPELERAGCAVSLTWDGPLVGWWDRLRLEQVLTNLLTNASKYGPGQPIQIAIFSTPEHVMIRVRDHGIGIAPEDHERIFERFARAVSEKNYGGLGLGLWITRELLGLMGGRIEVRSEPSEGATFTVYLPRSGLKPSREARR
ncbi:Sensory box histidine kinase [Hyalangium minutum]|uniref:histidine kinase n=1 Tax=Hyalangium minutum TaxID=394096 RepID=A0A085WVW0_9BACT|nr:Sensory box histidine kinase [Hyalangium minutum]